MSRACRHCGSPSRMNPCWYGQVVKEWNPNIDPPCSMDDYDDGQRELARRRRGQMMAALAIGGAIVASVLLLRGVLLYGQS